MINVICEWPGQSTLDIHIKLKRTNWCFSPFSIVLQWFLGQLSSKGGSNAGIFFFHFMKTSTCLCLRFEVTSLRIAISDNKLQWSIRWRGKLSGFGTDIMKRWNIIHCRNSQHCLFPIPVKNSFWFWYKSLQVQIKKSYLPWVPQLIWLIKSCPTSNTSSVHLDSRFLSAVKVFFKWTMWKNQATWSLI